MKLKQILPWFIAFNVYTSAQVYALTVSSADSEIRRLIKDDRSDISKRHYSAQVLIDRMNLGQIDVVAKSNCLEGREFISVSTNGYVFDRSTYTLKTLRVGFQFNSSSSTFKLLLPMTIDTLTPEWESKPAGFPQNYFTRVNTITLFPKCSGLYSGYKIRHDFVKKPEVVDDSSDSLLDGQANLEAFSQLIIYYVSGLCQADLTGDLSAASYYKLYLENLKILTSDKW